MSQIVPWVPATSSRRSIPPRNVQLTSNWPIAPDSNRMSAIALSSSAIGWTSVSVWHSTSTGRLPLPTKLRMISMQWQPRSMIAPPPVSRPSQNQARVRARVRLARADPGHVADRAVLAPTRSP